MSITENVSFEQSMQKLVQELEEKEKKCNDANLKMGDNESNKKSDIPDTKNEEKIDVRTSKKEQQASTSSSEDGSKTLVQGMDNAQKIKQAESNTGMSTRSSTTHSQQNNKVCCSEYFFCNKSRIMN